MRMNSKFDRSLLSIESLQSMEFKSWVGFIGLSVLAVLGNYFATRLFFTIDMIWGSIATLVVLLFFGLPSALFTSVLAAATCTYLWGHPFGGVALIMEAFVVGTLLYRYRLNLVAAVCVYWVAIGIPFIWLTYTF